VHNKLELDLAPIDRFIVEYFDYHIPVTQLKGQKGTVDMQAAKPYWNAPLTSDLNIWLCGRFSVTP